MGCIISVTGWNKDGTFYGARSVNNYRVIRMEKLIEIIGPSLCSRQNHIFRILELNDGIERVIVNHNHQLMGEPER